MEKNNLKKETFAYLVSNRGQANSLIVASLIISLYFEKCISKQNDKLKPLVSKSFLKECANLLQFCNDDKKMESLNYLQKINLIRGKLAHGDYVISPYTENIVIETDINGESVSSEIPIESIVSFANNLARYSRYPKPSKKRETIHYKDGYEFRVIDVPKKSIDRNRTYEKKLEHIVNKLVLSNHGYYADSLDHKKMLIGIFDIVVHVNPTDIKENCVNEYPERKLFEWGLINRLNNPQNRNHVCDDFIDTLVMFYKYYIYPLENFLKGQDKNIMSLLSDEMFGFEKLNISDELLKDIPYVGKVDSYIENQSTMYDKINNLYDEFVEVENDDNNSYYDNTPNKNRIEQKLIPYIDTISNPSVMNIYSYGKKRSFIEHIRCAIEHGTYDFDYNTKSITFIDSWQDKYFKDVISIYDFYSLFSKENRDLIFNQFGTVYNIEGPVRTR